MSEDKTKVPAVISEDGSLTGTGEAEVTTTTVDPEGKKPKRGHVARCVLLAIVALLVVIGAFGVSFGLSASRVMSSMTAANDSFEEFKGHLSANEIAEASDAVDQMSASAEVAAQEIQGWQWAIARNIPVIGDDVRDVCGLVEVTDSLAGDVLMPIISSYNRLTDGGKLTIDALESLDPATLFSKAGQLRKLMRAISGSSEVINDCDVLLGELPDSHFEQIQELVDSMRRVVGDLNAVLGGIDSEEDAVEAMGDLISMI